jgi:glyoxylase-like metal-dependent hydrolase (beta-lactamase superfamily II)
MPAPPVSLAPGVWRIPTLGADLINSFAFVDDDGSVVLVDAGLRGAPKRLATALSEIGKRTADVSTILLTHAHPDHGGGARGMRQRSGAPVHTHVDDAEFLRDGRTPPRGVTGPLGRVFAMVGNHQPSCPVDGTFVEGDVVPVAGGLAVLHTPGHSPGHCSFLHQRSGVLITGDALFNFRNKMAYSFALLCSNAEQSRQTAERLGDADYEICAFTHGPELRHDARQAVRRFLARRHS